MNHNHSVFSLLLIFALSCNLWAENVNHLISSGQLRVEKTWQGGEPVSLELESFSLKADSGVLLHDLSVSLTLLPSSEISSMPSNMVNVTGDFVGAYRLLPNGTHFSEPAIITIPYDALPLGYRPSDIYTFYYDEEISQWQQLERVSVDTTLHTISSYTTHFTDFINAIVKTPEMPETNAFVPTFLSDLEEPHPLAGLTMVNAPEANNMGTADVTYPIEIPQGRAGVTPHLSLQYSSAQGNGMLGIGWSMPLPCISLDTRWGVPRYSSAYETEIYYCDGVQLVMETENPQRLLPYQRTGLLPRQTGDVQFVFRDPKNMCRVTRKGASPENYRWLVVDKNGTKFYYGCYSGDSKVNSSCVLTDANGNIVHWALGEIVDVHGNYIRYEYDISDGNEIYPRCIYYTGFRDSEMPYYRIDFHYATRVEAPLDCRLGFMRTTDSVLTHIRVSFLQNGEFCTKRIYRLEYSPEGDDACRTDYPVLSVRRIHDLFPNDEREAQRVLQCRSNEALCNGVTTFDYYSPLLCSMYDGPDVIVEGENTIFRKLGSSYNRSHVLGGAVTFGFGTQAWQSNLSAGGNYNHTWTHGGTKMMMMDIDGDGLTDKVYARHGTIKIQRQREDSNHNVVFLSEEDTGIPAKELTIDAGNVNTWGLQAGADLEAVNFSISGGQSITNTYTDTYFADVNGDGMPDYINNGDIYFNRLHFGLPFLKHNGDSIVRLDSAQCGAFICNGEAIPELSNCKIEVIVLDKIVYQNYGEQKTVDYDVFMKNLRQYIENNNISFIRDYVNFALDKSDLELLVAGLQTYNVDLHALMCEQYCPGETEIEVAQCEDCNEIPLVFCSECLDYLATGEKTKYLDCCDGLELTPKERALQNWKMKFADTKYVHFKEQGNTCIAYLVDTICREPVEPNIESVKVWVAPRSGIISISNNIYLMEDSSYSRTQSRTADGVYYSIQHNQDVSVDHISGHHRLKARASSLLLDDYIEADDYSPKQRELNNISVLQGDVLFFRLMSNRSHEFDNVSWTIEINDTLGNRYHSAEDFVLSTNSVVQTDTILSAQFNIAVRCPEGDSALLCVHNGVNVDTIVIQASVSNVIRSLVTMPDTAIYLSLSPISGNLGNIELSPQLYMWSEHRDTTSIWLAPRLNFQRETVFDSVYYDLFGPLYRGWGQFGYNNKKNNYTQISINSLRKYSRETANTSESNFANSIQYMDTTKFYSESDLTSEFARAGLYTPLAEDWLEMKADPLRYCWESYGNVGRIGRSMFSNTRDNPQPTMFGDRYQSLQDSEDNRYIYYDNSVPILSDEEGSRVVRKHSKSVSWNISAGVGFNFPIPNHEEHNIGGGVGYAYSSNKYTLLTDYLDLNGDRYPDVVQSDYVQYTLPWGALDEPDLFSQLQQYTNESKSKGVTLSGNYTYTNKIPGSNLRQGTFFSRKKGNSIGETISHSESVLSYIDINGDGLPDKISKKSGRIYISYNLGYSFSAAVPLENLYRIDHNYSAVTNGGASFDEAEEFVNIDRWFKKGDNLVPNTAEGYFQMSLSFGIDASYSDNQLAARLIDLNGDGFLDYVEMLDTDNLLVKLNNGQSFDEGQVLSSWGKMQSSKTYNAGISLAFTAGYTMAFFKITGGINGTPIAYSWTNNTHELIDMNGDGLPDLVWISDNDIHIRYNQLGKRNLLKTVTNFNGQKIEIDYKLSKPNIEQHGRHWQMSKMEIVAPSVDHICSADTMRREYEYSDPHYSSIERMQFGYGTVVTKDIDRTIDPHSVYRQVVRHYNNQDFLEHGKLIYEALTDSAFHRYTEYKLGTLYVDSAGNATDNTCEDMHLRIGTESHITSFFEGAEDSIVTAKQFQYDKYYNVTNYHNLGDITILDDDVQAAIVYDSTDVLLKKNLISLPNQVSVFGNGVLTYEMGAEYDDNGQVVEYYKRDFLDNHFQQTRYKYDNYGLNYSIITPSNYRGQRDTLVVFYDTYSHSLPSRVVNHWGGVVERQYDPYWQRPIWERNPTKAQLGYEYDMFGRCTRVHSIDDSFWYYNAFDLRYNYTRTSALNILPSQHAVSSRLYLNIKDEILDSISSLTISDTRGRIVCKADVFPSVGANPIYRYYQISHADCFGREDTIYMSHFSNINYLNNMTNASLDVKGAQRFDIMDRVIRSERPTGEWSSAEYLLGQTPLGVKSLLQKTTDENGHVWHNFCSTFNKPLVTMTPDSAITMFQYDAFGQPLHVKDPDGLETFYRYDGFGNVVERNHPDAGVSQWVYDDIGNMIASSTNQQRQMGTQTEYEYDYNRLTDIHYPNDSTLNVHFLYDAPTGRMDMRSDITGTESFSYDALGNVVRSQRTIYLPWVYCAYQFNTNFEYNALGQMLCMTYPDGENLSYRYKNGLLCGVSTNTPLDNTGKTYFIDSLCYDADNNISYMRYGNGVVEEREVDPITSWLSHSYLYAPTHELHDINYSYDGVGNISLIEQNVDQVSSMGSAYVTEYLYDSQNRLINANMISDDIGDYTDYSLLYSPSGMMGIKSIQDPSLGLWFGYSKGDNTHKFLNHQPRSVYNVDSDEKLFFAWNQDGQMVATYDSMYDYQRIHYWDDAGQLSLFMSKNQSGMYVYDGTGQRTYKLSGTSLQDRYNAGEEYWISEFDDAVLYVSPFLVITPRGYFKHYYNGSERFASRIGARGERPTEMPIIYSDEVYDYQYKYELHLEHLLYENEFECPLLNDTIVDIDGESYMELQETHQGDFPFIYVDAYPSWTDILSDCVSGYPELEPVDVHGHVRFYHSDHLGSTSWVTDETGTPIQYLHYLPYGEPWMNQRATSFDERFTFTGKERDQESGYYYHGARYYSSLLGIWLSVDPLVDKYLWISPYAYCMWNPIKYVDPDGRNAVDKIAGIILGSVTNLIPYASLSNLRDAYTPNDLTDYTSTLTIVDNLALAAGGYLTAQGASDVMRGLALLQCGGAVASTGIGAPEGGTIVAIGGKLVGTGLLEATGGAVLMTNALNNLSVGASQNQKGTTNTHQFSDSRRMTENEISQYFNDPNWHKGNYKNAMINKFRKELKGSTNADFYIDTKTNQVYLKGNKSGAWVDTGDTLIK